MYMYIMFADWICVSGAATGRASSDCGVCEGSKETEDSVQMMMVRIGCGLTLTKLQYLKKTCGNVYV